MSATNFVKRTDSGSSAFLITPNDSTDFLEPTRGIIITVAGTLNVIFEGDNAAISLPPLAVGVIHPLAIKRVLAAGTTATGLIGVL